MPLKAAIDLTGHLLEPLAPGGRARVRLACGLEGSVIAPLLGFDLAAPARLETGTVVRLKFDAHEDAYWVVGLEEVSP